ncbi:nucleotidyl transferase AbiEii/AbiGii toxin family protein [Bdellovibrionales bacterium]|nr:nucleotidyl transferase AbiEii/AbiGii toxin family protein [Bdellovibrionales bacterium]
MIDKTEITELSKKLDLRAETVEKDYVLGWVLAGIEQQQSIFPKWAFKGGTCLKKCFFETYRFSEDLDYTVSDKKHLEESFLVSQFEEISDWVYEESGVELPKDLISFEVYENNRGTISVEGKIGFKGPLGRGGNLPKIKFDLTADEALVLKPVKMEVHHPYTDRGDSGIYSNCYAYEEVFAEKVRALTQRARPRDLYDVIHLFRNKSLVSNHKLLFSVLEEKCEYKKMDLPTFETIKNHPKREELDSEWDRMLAHQLPLLPSLETFWQELPDFFEWLYNGNVKDKIVSKDYNGESLWQPGRIVNAYSVNSIIERIQFAAANRVCVELVYTNKKKTIEPYSFRIGKANRKLFYGYHRKDQQIKCFPLDGIQSITVTNAAYTPRYPVEISSTGRVSMPPVSSRRRR